MLVSADERMQALAVESTRGLTGVTLHPILTFEELFSSDVLSNHSGQDGLPSEYQASDVAMILHSSGSSDPIRFFSLLVTRRPGSTNYPKPIHWTHKRLTSRATTPCEISQCRTSFVMK